MGRRRFAAGRTAGGGETLQCRLSQLLCSLGSGDRLWRSGWPARPGTAAAATARTYRISSSVSVSSNLAHIMLTNSAWAGGCACTCACVGGCVCVCVGAWRGCTHGWWVGGCVRACLMGLPRPSAASFDFNEGATCEVEVGVAVRVHVVDLVLKLRGRRVQTQRPQYCAQLPSVDCARAVAVAVGGAGDGAVGNLPRLA